MHSSFMTIVNNTSIHLYENSLTMILIYFSMYILEFQSISLNSLLKRNKNGIKVEKHQRQERFSKQHTIIRMSEHCMQKIISNGNIQSDKGNSSYRFVFVDLNKFIISINEIIYSLYCSYNRNFS